MNRRIAPISPGGAGKRALMLVAIMLCSSVAPMMMVPGVSAHESANDTVWPKSGSNDTGWVQLDAIGADPTTGTQASADWTLEFAPGADLSNVSFQVRVNGSDGLMIEEPMLLANDIGINLLDWRGLGSFGSSDSFVGANPYDGRLTPNSDSGATWTIPSDATITDLVIEALAPVDPAVSFEPIQLEIGAKAIHPDDGRMYLAILDDVLVLDYNNDPPIIDMIEFESDVLDMEIDAANNMIHFLTNDEGFSAISLMDSSSQVVLPDSEDQEFIDMDQFTVTSGGVFAAGESGLFSWISGAWSEIDALGGSNILDMLEVDGVLYIATDGDGVMRYSVANGVMLSDWSTANSLHSDEITSMLVSGNQLVMASSDAGLARYDWSSGFWLSTWNSGNWLSSNDVTGLARSGNTLYILNGDALHTYNAASNVFSGSQTIDAFGLAGAGDELILWPNTGTRSPGSELILVSDGYGALVELTPGSTPLNTGVLLLGSGPTSGQMIDSTELNEVLFVATDDQYLNRFDTQASRWIEPIFIGADLNRLSNDGNHVYIAADNGAHQMHANGTVLQTWDTTNTALSSSEVTVVQSDGSTLVVLNEFYGEFLAINLTGALPVVYESLTLDSGSVTDAAIHANVAYVGTQNDGLLRYDIANDTWLTPWISTGINGANDVPVAVVGDILYFGIPGYGVARKDLSTNEILLPLTESSNSGGGSSTEILPSDNIYALEANGNVLYIGTSFGAVEWNEASSTANSFQIGRNWDERPQQFFDFVVVGSNVYAATNIGVCEFPTGTLDIEECLNVYDGMPNWATYSIGVGISNTYLFGGTNSGVGIITISPFDVVGEWTAGEQTNNAPVVVVGDVAFIALDGIGIARYDIPNDEWLTLWTDDNFLDNGNEDATALSVDINPNYIWIGGADGFQLLNATTGAEVYDIEKSSSLFAGNGDPLDMILKGNTMYYHDGASSDNLYRFDAQNFTALSALDAGAQIGQNNGDVNGMGLIGDIIMISVASQNWWQVDGSGGIAQFNTSNGSWGENILPIGQVDRVTAYQSSTGNMWVSWGENSLQYMDANGTLLGEWDDDDFEFPIREIIEYDGEVLFATEEGVARFNESSNQWLTTWEEGSGLPNNAGEQIYELWTDGTNLVIGGGEVSGFGQFRNGAISHWDGTTWNDYSTGQNGIPNGYPITMTECAGLLHIGIYANNGGVARFDMANDSFLGTFTTSDWNENYGEVSGVACDSTDTLYVSFYEDEADVKKYSYPSNAWVSPITTVNHNLPSDRVWWDAIDYANGMLVLGHGIGTSGDNIIGGGYSAVATSGSSTAQVNFNGQGSSVTSFQWLTNEWLVGQAGGSSGYSHVDTISSLGQNTLLDFPGLVSGQVTSMAGNSTHIWVATEGASQGFGQNGASSGAGLLQGERLADGTIDWQDGWTMTANSVAKDMELIGTDLYITTTPTGLYKLDTLNGMVMRLNGGLHSNMDGLFVNGNTLVIGLQGSSGSAAGVQLYDLATGFGNGKLLGGLPSNVINAFAETSSTLYIATNGGVGRWDYAASDWMNPLTTSDGLPTNVVEDIQVIGTDVWMATAAGVVKMDTLTNATTLYSSGTGLMATSAQSLTTATQTTTDDTGTTTTVTTLFIGHDGAGAERPGVTSVEDTSGAIQWHKFDQLPSNTIGALASDWWGLHIATDVGPMTHYNGQSNQLEDGVPSFQVAGWPIQKMISDGDHVLAIGENGASILSARTPTHATLKVFQETDLTGGTITSDAVWLTTGEIGLFGFENNAQYTEMDRFTLRKANPLNVGFNLQSLDISDMTHPGMAIQLADLDNPVTLDPSFGVEGTNGILFQTVPLAFTSPVNYAATWAKSVSLKYNATIELNNNPGFETTMQLAVDNGIIVNGTQFVQLTLRSPANGSMHVRLIYDYVKTETPIALSELIDRPDDGGGALIAEWSLVHDDDFARYLVYVNEGAVWDPSGITVDYLSTRTVDKAISLHSRLSSEVTTANGIDLVDGTDYYAVVVVEYDDGRLGVPSPVIGPASPSDEVPLPPIWATAGPHEGGEDGDLDVEWSRCTSLDLLQTNIYASTQPMTDVLGLTPEAGVMRMEGNSTVLSLSPGQPYWLGLTCVDEAGQEDLMNALIVGPFVPTGGLNDNTPPPKMENVAAIDTPDDEGGRITVSWDANPAEDCTFYTIFMRTWDEAETPIDQSSMQMITDYGFTQAKIINDCSEESAIVTSIDGVALQDGQSYYVGVVAYDDWLNANLVDVTLVQVTPLRNTAGTGTTPDRVSTVQAFDHPDDDGTAIDVLWSISDADDFSHYTVWAADQPIADLTTAWAAFGQDPERCGCLKINKQWVDEDFNPIEITLTSALYSGTTNMMDLTSATPQLIQPGIELFVVVTVHDLSGNVHLTDLVEATVTPIDNEQDTEAPARLESLELVDRPSDDGSALLLDFELSDASDVGSYEVYAATWSFTSVGTGTLGPSAPIAILARSPDLPLTIDLVAGDTPVIPGQEIWAVVVVRDTSGNALTSDLVVVSSQSVDDGVDERGDYLPDVSGVTLSWVDESNILVTWTLSSDDSIENYVIYIAEDEYDTTLEATWLADVKASNSFLITAEIFEDLTNASAWYVGVTVQDNLFEKQAINPQKIDPVKGEGDDSTLPGDGNDGADFSSLLTTPNLLAAGLFFAAIILFIAVVRTRGNQRSRSKSWELQEATWGIQDDQGWGDASPATPPAAAPPMAPAAAPAADMYAPQQTQQDIYGRPAYQPAQPVMQPVQNNELLNELGAGPAPKQPSKGIDTSFLDDLL